MQHIHGLVFFRADRRFSLSYEKGKIGYKKVKIEVNGPEFVGQLEKDQYGAIQMV